MYPGLSQGEALPGDLPEEGFGLGRQKKLPTSFEGVKPTTAMLRQLATSKPKLPIRLRDSMEKQATKPLSPIPGEKGVIEEPASANLALGSERPMSSGTGSSRANSPMTLL